MFRQLKMSNATAAICVLLLLLTAGTSSSNEVGGENASNPLSKVKNTDLRWQYFDMDKSHKNDFSVEGAFMARDDLKIKYGFTIWKPTYLEKAKTILNQHC